MGKRTPVLPIAVSADRPIVTLLTDFGTRDYFVGSLKGVILSINPQVQLIDITHDIPAHDIEAGAFTLLTSYKVFPAGTTHVAVVDPGVGSSRRPLLVVAGSQFFIGPDNGIFSFIYEAESDYEVFELTNDMYFRHPVSATFHGRDIFAPVAAALSTGIAPVEVGSVVADAVRLPSIRLQPLENGDYKGRILHTDRFGNCVTNISREFLPPDHDARAQIRIKGKTIKAFRQFFTSPGSREKLFALWGSAGYLEIAAQEQSAARILKAKPGDTVMLSIKSG